MTIQWNTPDNRPPAWLTDHSLPIPQGRKVRRGYRRVKALLNAELAKCLNCGAIVDPAEDIVCPNCGRKL